MSIACLSLISAVCVLTSSSHPLLLHSGFQVYVSVECPVFGSKSAKSEGTKSSKSEAPLGKGPITTCETSQRDGCYQEVATCPTLGKDPVFFCNGNEAVGTTCILESDLCDNADGLDRNLNNCDGGDASIYASVACPGASKSAKSESIGDWSKSAKSGSKSAKSVGMVDTPTHPAGDEWVCGWKLPHGMTMPTMDELVSMIPPADVMKDILANPELLEEDAEAALALLLALLKDYK